VNRRSKDQDLIDDLAAWMQAPDAEAVQTNGHARARATTASPARDEMIIQKCRAAENAVKFSNLFDHGDAHAHHGGDDSAADLALVSMLAFYTQDEAQLERLISSSALGRREKWLRRDDYRKRTIRKALSNLGEVYDWPSEAYERQNGARSRSRSLGNKVMSNDPKRSIRAVSFRGREKPGPREWIVEKAVCRGHAASWYGEGGIAKSLLAAHMGIHIAADGVDYWAGLRVQTVPVIYGDFELDEDEHLRRAQELSCGMGLSDVPTKFHYLSLAGLPADEAFAAAAEECERLGAGLFIVDSVGYALDGDSELARDVLRFHKNCVQPIRDAGATPFLIDHQAKVIKGEKYSDKQEFGSVYKTNTVRSSFQIRGGWDGNELTATFTHKKTNFGPKVEDFSLLLRFGREHISVELLDTPVRDPDREPSKKEQVYAAVEELGQATAEAVHTATEINLQTVRNAISELVNEGQLVDTGEKDGRSRIVITHYRPTQGTGTGTGTNPSQGSPRLGEGAAGTEYQTVATLFANQPAWLPRQLEKFHEDPEKHLGPLCAAVAAVVLGDGARGDEVREEVERILEEGTQG
jgi:AAA domain